MIIPPFISLVFFIFLFQILSGGGLISVSGQCLNDQRSLLLQLKNSLTIRSTILNKLAGWDQNIDCCFWDGVGCDVRGRVIGLELDNQTISGGIENSTLFRLHYLERLNLAYNNFNNIQIPRELYNLTNLRSLNLSNAGFVGQIPIELSRMTNMVSLDFSTHFPGLQPLKLENPNLGTFLQNLTGIRELYLDGVDISSQRNEWCQPLSLLPELRNLSLRNCYLSGPIDSSLSRLQSLSLLQLDRNNLSTPVPDFFANFRALTTLSLSSCNLLGHFPEMIFQVPTLKDLELSNNALLGGTISHFPARGSLTNIALSHTNFSGTLPDSISNLNLLSKIDLSNCTFSGPIPSTMENLTEIVYLDFSFNNFTGFIPVFKKSRKLSYIDLSRNSLTGSLSTHFEGLTNLAFINLGSNILSGRIPAYLFALPSLEKLLLPNNHFGGQVQGVSSQNSSQLDTLDMSNNRLKGPIPEFFFELERLNVLSLSSNSFSGTLQFEKFQKLPNLTRLEIAYNKLSVDASHGNSSLSQFPQLTRLNLASCNLQNFPDLRKETRITFLDLSDNQIKGEIPSWIWDIGDGSLTHLNLSCNLLVGLQKPYNLSGSLSVLDLHFNQLQGEFPIPPVSAIYLDYSSNYFNSSIPPNIPEFVSFASFFSLANNSITGGIPISLCNATYMRVLDLSSNNLTGTIPPCLMGKNENLGVLNLGRNKLSGTIPDTFPVSCGLKTLDLSRNNIEGKIPGSLANCTRLEVLNIGNNKIEDTFPCLLKNLSTLCVLVLRSNRFHGDIRCQEANNSWPNLQIVDIASNNFSGHLYPKCFSSWRGMILNNDAVVKRNHISFNFLDLNKFYYQDTVTVTMKGLEIELMKILKVFTSIDFSCNNFQGKIPTTVGGLRSLYLLNLSHNALSGSMPESIGNLTQLGSLDLSMNQLTGEIPPQITNLNFLSFLNLSYNKLVGKIPKGSQLQTFSAASYEGNAGLCGFPLNTSCDINTSPTSARIVNKFDLDWQFIITGLGFGVGAALILAPLVFCKQWREQCDNYLEQYIKLIFPRYGFSYIRYDGKVEAAEKIEASDDDDEDEDEDETVEQTFKGRYCVFCTKLDSQRTKAIHNLKCTCHYSPPMFYSLPTSSPSSSLLIVYR